MTSIVFGNLPIPGQSGDRVVSKAVTAAISALFKQTEKLEAIVKAEPVAKLFQGSVDGFDFLGQGLLMYSGMRVQSMEFYVQAVSIDFGAIFRGQVKLRQSTQANMRIVLSEEDINASFNTPFLIEKLQNFQFQGQPLKFERTHFEIVGSDTLKLRSQVRVGQDTELQTVGFTAKVEVKDRRKIQFVDVEYGDDLDDQALSEVLVEHLNNLLDLDQFALDGMQLRVDQLKIRNKQMTLYGVAKITDFPKRSAKAAA